MLLEFEAAHGGDPRVEDAAFLAAIARARQGDRAGARALAQHYLDRYPRGRRRRRSGGGVGRSSLKEYPLPTANGRVPRRDS